MNLFTEGTFLGSFESAPLIRKRGILVCAIMLLLSSSIFSQRLETVPPVLGSTGVRDTTAFILSTWDGHYFLNFGHQRYGSSIQVIDASQPWPPRWFTCLSVEDIGYMPAKDEKAPPLFRFNNFTNVGIWEKTFSFYKFTALLQGGDLVEGMRGYIFCDFDFKAVDTLISVPGASMNYHEFSVNKKNERLALMDTGAIVNLAGQTYNAKDTQVMVRYETVAILDSTHRYLFRWNPLRYLNKQMLDREITTHINESDGYQIVDLVHDASVQWDFDGNLIFNIRYMGIGKISRADGSLMWFLDSLPGISNSDTFSFSEHHAPIAIADNDTTTTYSIFLNGNERHAHTVVAEFQVSKKNPGKIVNLKKIVPLHNVYSLTDGSYEKNKNGSFLLNYGSYPIDTAEKFHTFLEYRTDNIPIAEYKLPALNFAHKVHYLTFKKPPRPGISNKNGVLKAEGNMTNWIWYQLSGTQLTEVKEVGKGNTYAPGASGTYCVIGQWGIGYAVSLPFMYSKNKP